MKFMFRGFAVAGMFAIALSLLLAFSTEAQGEDWPKYMRDLANSGHSSETGINSSNVASLGTKWTFTTGGLVSASPAVATINGVSTVYVGVSSHGDQPCIVGRVDAYDELTGNTAWSFNTIDQTTCPSGTCLGASVWSSVAIDAVNGIVYAGTGNPGSTCNPATANAAL